MKQSNPNAVAWQSAMAAWAVALAAIIFLGRETLGAMVQIWAKSETFTHCFLVLPIVIWLVWDKRKDLSQITPRPDLRFFLFSGCAMFGWMMGNLAAVNAVSQLAVIAVIVFSVPALLGHAVARTILFPLAFLFFSVPIGEFLLPQLMNWTADFTVRALQLSGIPVYREGLQFVIPSGNWSVVEACSGVRYLIASATVGSLFAYLTYRTAKRRMLFFGVSILVPIVANWLRAYMIVMLGHLSGNKLAAGVDHLIYGWVFFGIVIMLMFMIGSRWSEAETIGRVESAAQQDSAESPYVGQALYWLSAGLLALMMALPAYMLSRIEAPGGGATSEISVPEKLGAVWLRRDRSLNFKPLFQNPSASVNTEYVRGQSPVGLYLGYFRDQNSERKLVSSVNVLVASNDPVWTQTRSVSRQVSLHGAAETFREAELGNSRLAARSADDRLLAWQIYWIGGTLTASDYTAKVYSAWYRLTGKGDDAAVIVVYTPLLSDGNGSVVLEQFLSDNYADIELILRRAAKRTP